MLRLVLTWKSDLAELDCCEHGEAGGRWTLPAWELICEVGAMCIPARAAQCIPATPTLGR